MNQNRPKNRRARNAKLTIGTLTLVVILLIGTGFALTWPKPEEGPAWMETRPAGAATPWVRSDTSGTYSYDEAWMAINEAMMAKDREAFLSFAEGEAVEQMARWWDNTTAIGWDIAYMSPSKTNHFDDVSMVTLGAELGFEARPSKDTLDRRSQADSDQGTRLTHGFEYFVETSGSGEDLRIHSLEYADPMPWDDGEIHVATREHAVIYGMADEAEFIEGQADLAEEMARLALERSEELLGERVTTGFVLATTADQERYERWRWTDGIDSAGFARARNRPQSNPVIPDEVAVGPYSSGAVVIIGPRSAGSVGSVMLHEYAHAIHYLGAPTNWSNFGEDTTTPSAEGFARFFEEYSGVADLDTSPGMIEPILTDGMDAISYEALRDVDDNQRVHRAYNAAGLFYRFVAETGGVDAVWDVARMSFTFTHLPLVEVATDFVDSQLSEENWVQWARQL